MNATVLLAHLAHRLRGGLAALAAFAFFAPIPAYAFVWLMPSWSSNLEPPVPTAPTPTLSFSDTSNGGRLFINMGRYTASRNDSVAITASRTFRVGSGGRTLNINHLFETLARDADLEVVVRVEPLNGGPRIRGLEYKGSARNRDTILSPSGSGANSSVNLAAGDYRMVVRVKYNKKASGLWDNTAPAPGSPHRLTFSFI